MNTVQGHQNLNYYFSDLCLSDCLYPLKLLECYVLLEIASVAVLLQNAELPILDKAISALDNVRVIVKRHQQSCFRELLTDHSYVFSINLLNHRYFIRP